MINLNTSRSHFVFTLNSLTTRSDKGFRGSLIPVTIVGGGGGGCVEEITSYSGRSHVTLYSSCIRHAMLTESESSCGAPC